MIRVALDAMGGDHAPRVEIEGARGARASADLPGPARRQARRHRGRAGRHPTVDRSRVDVVPAPEVIGMGDKPLAAIRGRSPTPASSSGSPCRRPATPTRSSPPATPAPSWPPPPSCSASITASSGPASPRRFPPRSPRAGPRRRRQRRLLRPGAGLFRAARLGLRAGRAWARRVRWSGCSTSARKTRRATPSSGRPTISSSRRRASTSSATSRAATSWPAIPSSATWTSWCPTASSATSCSSSTSRWPDSSSASSSGRRPTSCSGRTCRRSSGCSTTPSTAARRCSA